MKAEITPENKAKFFAQYYPQRILHHVDYEDYCPAGFSDELSIFYYVRHNYYLGLKPLSSISDEDVIGALFMNGFPEGWELYKVYTLDPTAWVSVKLRRKYGESDIHFNEDGYEYKDHFLNFRGFSLSSWSDNYLRSKGYAVDWMGLTVAEMVEAGWVKLSES